MKVLWRFGVPMSAVRRQMFFGPDPRHCQYALSLKEQIKNPTDQLPGRRFSFGVGKFVLCSQRLDPVHHCLAIWQVGSARLKLPLGSAFKTCPAFSFLNEPFNKGPLLLVGERHYHFNTWKPHKTNEFPPSGAAANFSRQDHRETSR